MDLSHPELQYIFFGLLKTVFDLTCVFAESDTSTLLLGIGIFVTELVLPVCASYHIILAPNIAEKTDKCKRAAT